MAVKDHFTDRVTVYQPTVVVKQDDLNVVPGAYALVKSRVACNIHRGDPDAEDRATQLGIVATQAAYVFFDTASYALLKDRGALLDDDGAYWIIRGRPFKRNRFANTAHVRVLATLALQKPKGIPDPA